MKKRRFLILLGIALLVCAFATSCYSTAHNTCPAYRGGATSHYKG